MRRKGKKREPELDGEKFYLYLGETSRVVLEGKKGKRQGVAKQSAKREKFSIVEKKNFKRKKKKKSPQKKKSTPPR